ncbi:MAG: hypothetical protein KAG56_08760 [Sulfurovaceae bacterium]|nr:hypothetical protein [Sulfurovaceae bacterium]
MKKILLTIVLLTSILFSATQQGENLSDWEVYTKEKGTITEYYYDHSAAQFSGNKMKTGYKLKLSPKKKETIISWYMTFHEFYAIYIEVSTLKGKRTLRYTSLNTDIGKKGKYISFGLGSKSINHTPNSIASFGVTRDLQLDLEKFEPGNKIISLDTFLIRGSGVIDNILTYRFENEKIITKSHHDWTIFTKTKGTLTSSQDSISEADANHYTSIKLSGKGMKTGYSMSFPTLDYRFKTVGWEMKYSENYAIYFLVNTTHGVKYLRYSSLDYDKGIHGRYISFGLGAMSKDGKWHPFKRNLQKDLNKFEPNTQIKSISAFMIRGSGLINNIKAIAKDSSATSIKNFNVQKFNTLLEKSKNNYYDPDAKVNDTSYERVKYITYLDTNDEAELVYPYTIFYTLSPDQTELKRIITIRGHVSKEINFNSDYTRMTFGAYEILI